MKCVLFLSILLNLVFVGSTWAETSGTCGVTDTACHWELRDLPNGEKELIISGNGNMTDYGGYWQDRGKTPWNSQNSHITKITISDDIKRIGNFAFYGVKAPEIKLPSHLRSIGNYAFASSGLKSIDIPDTLTSMGCGLFYQNKNIEHIVFPDKNIELSGWGFGYASNLKGIFLPDKIVDMVNTSIFEDYSGDIYCSEEKAVICAQKASSWKAKSSQLKFYSKVGSYYSTGGKLYRDLDHMIKGVEMKRIYTVKEATDAAKGNKNTFSIRYR